MTAFDFSPGLRWLFCMTHPDDEISVAGLLHRLIHAGVEVHLSWTHSNPVREAEARAVFSMLPASRLTFFGAPDGRVLDSIPELRPRFVELMQHTKPDRVVCGAFEQGHLDHDATNLLVHLGREELRNLEVQNETRFQNPKIPKSLNPQVTNSQIPVFEAPFYHTYLTKLPRVGRFADPAGEEVLNLSTEELRFKLKVAKSYPSQRIWWNLIWANARAVICGDGSLTKTERLRLQTHANFLLPNVPPRLLHRVLHSAKWQRWSQVINQSGILEP